MLDNPFSEEFFLNMQSKPPLISSPNPQAEVISYQFLLGKEV